jgi:hypothetical protein
MAFIYFYFEKTAGATFLMVYEPLPRRAMSERIHELLHRNLQEVFGEGNAARRRAAILELYTDDCVLYVPPGIFVGHDALHEFAGDPRSTHPHFAYVPHGAPQALHNAGRLAWGSGPRGRKPDYTGLDVIIVRDGKIAPLYVFLDPSPS